MRILLSHKNTVIDGSMGGFSTVYFNLAQKFANYGHDVYVLTKHSVSSSFGINFVPVIISSSSSSEYSYAVRDLIISINPQIIECATWSSECLEYLKTIHKAPVIIRGDIPAIKYGEVEAGLRERQMLELANSTIAVSYSMKKMIAQEYNIDCQKVIYNAVDDEVFYPYKDRLLISKNPKKRRIVWVGRPTYIKGFDILLEIISALPL